MKKEFLYEQYNSIEWKNQEKTEMNSFVNEQIISDIISKYQKDSISLFDIGFGVGFFLKMFLQKTSNRYEKVHLEGCEPSKTSYDYFVNKSGKGMGVTAYHAPFSDVAVSTAFDVITAVYVLPHIEFVDLEITIKKIFSMLNSGGRFYCVITNEKSYKTSEKNDKDLFNVVEKNDRVYEGKHYTEFLHKSLLPEIGYVLDFNRDEDLYADMFSKNGFVVEDKKELNDGYFLNTLFVFRKD